MRKGPVAAFMALMCVVCALAGMTLRAAAALLAALSMPSLLNGVAAWLAATLLIHLYAIMLHRTALRVIPLRAGQIESGSLQECVYQVYILFYLMVFNTLLRGGWLPIPLLRPLYLALGAQLGPNTYSSGIICDPLFVRVGANTMLGESSLLVPHVIEGGRLAHFPIVIGDGVTIGAHAVLLSDVTIGDHAIVAANSVVCKGARIGAGQVWGGSPARLLLEKSSTCAVEGRVG
ncbi:DapH/DapD/GlmU-related protein [Rugamonas sp.]|uniref:acyltransferase n=1 Tax=Rugamonas sp. TaxID=1926287 RepID=UPI0025F2C7BA|nr:DapH/DapD/GlmU-related protein [Rugamonas sp.]